MCGLYGFINRGTNKKLNVKGLVKGLAVSAKTRGSHATGISYNVDSHLCTIKAAVPADAFTFDIPKDVNAVIGHTRHTTQGSELKNYNNHPFNGVAGDTMFSLAHNGVLDNDFELQYSEKLPKTEIQTDSYVAVQLLEKYAKDDKSLTLDSIRKMSELVSGMFAFSILDSNNQFWLVRNDSPIHMVYFEKYNLYVYGSTEQIVKDGLKKAGLTEKYQVIEVKAGTIVNIDLDGELSFFTFNVNERYYNYYNPKYAIANGGKSTTTTKKTSNDTCGYVPYNSMTSAGYSWGQREDVLRYDLYEEGLTDDEVDLVLAYYSVNELEQAMYNGQVANKLLEALRDYYQDMQERGYESNEKKYISPLYKY